jgi:hypothetical protein
MAGLCRLVLRLLVILAIAGIGALLVEARWDGDNRTLALRLRRPAEAARTGLEWGERWAGTSKPKRARRPDVASGPASAPAPEPASPDRLTPEDRARLHRLLEEKLRE